MTEALMSPETLAALAPERVTPGVLFLCSEDAPTGAILAAGAGGFAVARIYETEGGFIGDAALSVEAVRDAWPQLTDEAGQRAYRASGEQVDKLLDKARGG
jgi:hypothetical protein